MPIHAVTLALVGLLVVAQSQSQAPPPPVSPLAAAAAAARGRAEAGFGTSVELTFAWPAGMTAVIEAERSRTRVIDGKAQGASAQMRYRMRVADHPDGRIITYDDFELRTPLPAGDTTALAEMLSSFMPSLIVSGSGDFVRVADLGGIRAAMRPFIDPLKEKAGGVPANVRALIEGLSSDKMLSDLAAADWRMLAGVWAGFSGRIGEVADVASEEPFALMPGVTIPMRTRYAALRQTPCEPGRAPDSCVVLQMRSTAAPGAMQALIKKLMAGAPGIDDIAYEQFEVTTDVQVTLEPSTMRPFYLTQTRTGGFVLRTAGKRQTASQTDQRVYRFHYN